MPRRRNPAWKAQPRLELARCAVDLPRPPHRLRCGGRVDRESCRRLADRTAALHCGHGPAAQITDNAVDTPCTPLNTGERRFTGADAVQGQSALALARAVFTRARAVPSPTVETSVGVGFTAGSGRFQVPSNDH
jgi:hypothetical protein